jgi:hypothetical protein
VNNLILKEEEFSNNIFNDWKKVQHICEGTERAKKVHGVAFTTHAKQRMIEREISVSDVLKIQNR